MDPSLPPTHRALIQTPHGGGHPLVLSPSQPLPALRAGQVLVRVHAVALNPTDWKMPANFPVAGAVGGCDFAGEVVVVGAEAGGSEGRWAVGDRVFGCVHGSNPLGKDNGAFGQYVAADADLVVRVPGGMGWDRAAAWGGIGWGTCGVGLWDADRGLGLKWPWGKSWSEGTEDGEAIGEYVLVNGGATATGTLAVQLLKLAGYKPLATCSPAHSPLLKSLGAVSTFDYNDPNCASSIRTQTRNGVKHVFDCIADTASVQLCYAAMSRGGGRYACLELPSIAVLESRKAVSWKFIMAYEMFGREIALGEGYGREGNEVFRREAASWAQEWKVLVDQGLVKSHAVEVLRGMKWEHSILKGLERLKRGEARGVRLVVMVNGT